MDDRSVLLVGAGPMAVEYAKVLRDLGIVPAVVGRGEASAAKFESQAGVAASRGGLERWLAGAPGLPRHAIVATGERRLGEAARALMAAGVRSILVEKPGGCDEADVRAVAGEARRTGSRVFVGYNRRFYASVRAAKAMIAEDGGVTSFAFEFTEWSHVIGPLEKEPGVKEEWYLHNSTHVVDLAFHLGGAPESLCAFAGGELAWHPAGSRFAGAGRAAGGALFSYQANWQAPGRWGVEVLTARRRLILRPLEKLQVQKVGSVAIEEAAIDDDLDKRFKPGLHAQVAAFLAADASVLPAIERQAAMLDWYCRIRAGR
jgi:predicted dehydrogenase